MARVSRRGRAGLRPQDRWGLLRRRHVAETILGSGERRNMVSSGDFAIDDWLGAAR